MLELFSAVVLALHLACMNVAAAGPLLSVWLDRRAGRREPGYPAAARFLANSCLVLILAGGLLGFLQGWLRWDAEYRAVVARFGPRITWGLIEYAFSTLLIAFYAAWVALRPQVGRWGWTLRSLVAVVAATNLLYHFPPLFSMLAGAAAGQVDVGDMVDSAAFRRLLLRGEIMALAVHFVIASFAVTSTLLLAFGAGLIGGSSVRGSSLGGSSIGDTPADRRPIAVRGGRVALAMTLLQLPVGIWLMVQLPQSAQRQLLGEDPWSASMLVAALLASFWLLHPLAAVAFGDVSRRAAWQTVAAMCTVVVLMAGVLQRAQARHETNRNRGVTHDGSVRYFAGS